MVKNILNYDRSKPEFLRFLWDIVVFRLVAYLMNMICLNLIFYTKFYIYRFSYKFDTVLYQFLETGTWDRTLMGLHQLLKCLGFSLYPFSFFLYSPFKISIEHYCWRKYVGLAYATKTKYIPETHEEQLSLYNPCH